MTEDDLLTRLPEAGYPANPLPLPRIVDRAHEIRRGRRRFALAGIGTAAAGLAVLGLWTGIPLPAAGPGSVTPASAQDAGRDCSVGYAYTAQRNTLADLLFLPSAATAGPITGAIFGRRETSNCAYTKPEGIAYAMTDGVVSKRMEVSGPDARNRYDFSTSEGSFGGTSTQAAVGGGTATLYSMDGADWIYMFWTAADGSTWSITSDGLTRAELVSAAGGLAFRDGKLETADVPAGFDAWAGLPTVPYTTGDRHQYRYVLVPFHGGGDSPGWEFQISDRPSFSDAPIGGREVQVGTVTGWWSGNGGGGKGQGRLVWRVGGAELTVSGNSAPITQAQALGIARSVTAVAVDDARLEAAWER